MKVMQSGRSNRTPANYFSAYMYASYFMLGVLVRRTIWFWAFWSNFLAHNTPVRRLTEALSWTRVCCPGLSRSSISIRKRMRDVSIASLQLIAETVAPYVRYLRRGHTSPVAFIPPNNRGSTRQISNSPFCLTIVLCNTRSSGKYGHQP